MSKFSSKFYLNKSKVQGSKHKLYLRLILDRKKAEMAFDYFINPKTWDASSQETTNNDIINQTIAETKAKIIKVKRELEEANGYTSAKEIKMALEEGDLQKQKMLNDLYIKYIDEKKIANEISKRSIEKYDETRRYVNDFILILFGNLPTIIVQGCGELQKDIIQIGFRHFHYRTFPTSE